MATELGSVPNAAPYLRVAKDAVSHWSARLGATRRRKIGIAWSGRPTHKNDHNRSIALGDFLKVFAGIDATVVSLQREVRDADAAMLRAALRRHSFRRGLEGFRRHRGADRKSRSRRCGRHQRGPSRRRARQAGLGAVAVHAGLALAARSRRQPLVSERAPVPAGREPRLGQRDRARQCGAAGSGAALIHHHAADALAVVHEIEPLVDVGERHRVGDHRVDLNLAVHVPVDDLGHVGAAAGAAEGAAAPDASGDELERPRRDLLAGAGDADDDALAPAAMAAFERDAHQFDIADAFERVVGAADLVVAALGHVDQMRHEIGADLGRIDEMRHAEAFAPGLLVRIEIDADDHVGAGKFQALNDIEPDAAEPEHDAFGAGLDLGGIDHRADAGGDAAADIADLVERRVGTDFRHRDLRQHGEIGEGRAAHIVMELLPADRKARACRRASRPGPGWRGSRCTDWSCATGRTGRCGIPAYRAG